MRLEIEVGAIGDAHQLVPLPLFVFTLRKKAILNIDRALGVMGQLFLWLLVKPQVRIRDADALKPLITGIDPFLMRSFVFTGSDEVFHLHLFKLAGAKDEIAGRDFVTKRLAHLRNTKRELPPAGDEYVEKVYEDALRGFRTEVSQRRRIIIGHRAELRPQHCVKGSRLSPIMRTA